MICQFGDWRNFQITRTIFLLNLDEFSIPLFLSVRTFGKCGKKTCLLTHLKRARRLVVLEKCWRTGTHACSGAAADARADGNGARGRCMYKDRTRIWRRFSKTGRKKKKIFFILIFFYARHCRRVYASTGEPSTTKRVRFVKNKKWIFCVRNESLYDDVSDLGLRPSTGNGLLKSRLETPSADGPSGARWSPSTRGGDSAVATSDDRDGGGARRCDVTRPSAVARTLPRGSRSGIADRFLSPTRGRGSAVI